MEDLRVTSSLLAYLIAYRLIQQLKHECRNEESNSQTGFMVKNTKCVCLKVSKLVTQCLRIVSQISFTK